MRNASRILSAALLIVVNTSLLFAGASVARGEGGFPTPPPVERGEGGFPTPPPTRGGQGDFPTPSMHVLGIAG